MMSHFPEITCQIRPEIAYQMQIMHTKNSRRLRLLIFFLRDKMTTDSLTKRLVIHFVQQLLKLSAATLPKKVTAAVSFLLVKLGSGQPPLLEIIGQVNQNRLSFSIDYHYAIVGNENHIRPALTCKSPRCSMANSKGQII